MKNRIFLGGICIVFMFEFVILALFALPKAENMRDTVAVNEVMQTVKGNWDSLKEHIDHTAIDYVVLDLDGAVLYQTRPGLSESVNAAISHKDTILDIEIAGETVGRLIVYNSDAQVFQSEKRTVIFVVMEAMFIQCGICAGYFFYVQRTVIKPFHKMKGFAERIAGGNLDIPLTMDRQKLFGAFTESLILGECDLGKYLPGDTARHDKLSAFLKEMGW